MYSTEKLSSFNHESKTGILTQGWAIACKFVQLQLTEMSGGVSIDETQKALVSVVTIRKKEQCHLGQEVRKMFVEKAQGKHNQCTHD